MKQSTTEYVIFAKQDGHPKEYPVTEPELIDALNKMLEYKTEIVAIYEEQALSEVIE